MANVVETEILPMADRIAVRPTAEADQTVGGLFIPGGALEKPMSGEVVARGTGRVSDTGTPIPMTVQVGEKVLFGKYTGTEVPVNGETLLILRESDVLAVLR